MKRLVILFSLCLCSIFSYAQEAKNANEVQNKLGVFISSGSTGNIYKIQAHYLFYKDFGMGLEYHNTGLNKNIVALNATSFTGLPNSLKDIKFRTSLGFGYYWGKHIYNKVQCPVITYNVGLNFPILEDIKLYFGIDFNGYSSFKKNFVNDKNICLTIGYVF